VEHNITYDYNQKIFSYLGNGLYPNKYTEGTATGLPSTSEFSVAEGYVATGWMTSSGAIISEIPATATSDYDLTLGFKSIQYTIHVTNSGVGAAGPTTTDYSVVYGDGTQVPANSTWTINGTDYSGGSDVSRLSTVDGAVINATES